MTLWLEGFDVVANVKALFFVDWWQLLHVRSPRVVGMVLASWMRSAMEVKKVVENMRRNFF